METYNDKYTEWSKSKLIDTIIKMEETIVQMEKESDEEELMNFPWLGNLGKWHWIVQTNDLIFNKKKATNLGYEKNEIPRKVGQEFFTSKLHPDDYERVMESMRNHLNGITDAYEVEYRILTKDGHYAWYYDRGKISKRDKGGKPYVVTGIVFDISKNKKIEKDLKKANNKLRKIAHNDVLTKAYNRRFMENKIKNKIKNYEHTKEIFSLIMIDIDNFKLVNDNYGHDIGDKVLKTLVSLIIKEINANECISRWGGDEFIILLPKRNLKSSVDLSKKIKNILYNTSVNKLDGIEVSIGISTYSPGDSLETTLKKVDKLMYKSKNNGKNRISF